MPALREGAVGEVQHVLGGAGDDGALHDESRAASGDHDVAGGPENLRKSLSQRQIERFEPGRPMAHHGLGHGLQRVLGDVRRAGEEELDRLSYSISLGIGHGTPLLAGTPTGAPVVYAALWQNVPPRASRLREALISSTSASPSADGDGSFRSFRPRGDMTVTTSQPQVDSSSTGDPARYHTLEHLEGSLASLPGAPSTTGRVALVVRRGEAGPARGACSRSPHTGRRPSWRCLEPPTGAESPGTARRHSGSRSRADRERSAR